MKIRLIPKDDLAQERIRGYEYEARVVSLKPVPFNKSYYIIELTNHTSPSSKMMLYLKVNDDPDFDYTILKEENSGHKQSPE